ncbi:phosphate/phosphite/phosphonate ABC transporter substrate-binding protein [bacterium]|nr:phosphate/phosphite/phosphonate ABC transporter substrate-binding protein [bacterium]
MATPSGVKLVCASRASRWPVPLMLLSAILLIAGCGEEPPTVNMQDVVPIADADEVHADGRPVLRVAIAAMISPERTRDRYEELIQLLADKLDRRAVFSQRRTYAEISALVANKEVDVAFVCAGPYVDGHDEFGMELLVVPVAHGRSVYHSYILVHRDSEIQTFDDLRGKRFAFTDPQSNTGCLVPRYMLATRDETPGSFFSETFYSRSHDNSIQAVADGAVDGVAVDSLIWEFMNTVDPSITGRTRIIEKSPPYGIPPVVVHPDLPTEQKDTLREAFLTLHNDPGAAALLRHVQIDRYAVGDDAAYDTVREMQRWVRDWSTE